MLYVIGTPIGNLDDLSLRQSKHIANADVLLCEDTGSAGHILQRIVELGHVINPRQRRIAYFKDKELERLPEALNLLEQSLNVALISESGMPSVADPGYLLIHTARKQNLPITVIPGPTAFVNAAVLSGISHRQLIFIGFLPKSPSEIKKTIAKIRQTWEIWPDCLFTAYESPHRLQRTLATLQQSSILVMIARELTKIHEELVPIAPNTNLHELTSRGEITLLLYQNKL